MVVALVTITRRTVQSSPMKRLVTTTVCAATAAFSVATAPQEPAWNRTLDQISSGVVTIQVDSTRAFDTERNRSSQATGFVVDVDQGLILTNRHVVTPGPVVAQAIFLNQEEVELVPVYRDPVHDFGFFRYAPEHLRFIDPAELPLVPEAAQIGREIRVVGNDAGERMSFLAGTIARLDRQAPNYGRGNYNDFNTFYMQAASSTSGGSSGSPVLDIEGRVVALNAGASSQASSSFFLPLDRVRRALGFIQRGLPVPRGTLQTEFVHKPFAELRRLGLTERTEALVREAYPEQTGLLVVERVIVGAEAGEFLKPGDILVRVNGELTAAFVPMEAVLDDNVGNSVTLQIERGGEVLEQSLTVDDLHQITPDEFIQYGDGVFNNLSYQQARHFNRPISGVYVANPGYIFGSAAIPRTSLLLSVDGEEMRNLDDLQRVIERLPDDQRVTVRYVQFDDPQTERQRIITNDRDWFPAQRCKRVDEIGLWPCEELAPAPPARVRESQDTTFPPQPGERYIQRIIPSLVLVNFDMPYTVSGVSDHHYYGTGLIADAERGLVVVDRNTVPVVMGDVRITFAGSLEIPGRVEYVHPLHNLSIVSYDPELIGSTPTRSAVFTTEAVLPGDALAVVGLKPDHKLSSQSSVVAALEAVNFPLSRTLRFRESNLEGISLVNGPDDFDGVIVDRQGRVAALWATFAYQTGREVTQVNIGIPAELIVDMVKRLQDDQPLRSLEIEWRHMPLATARKVDLPESWVESYESHNPQRRQLLAVASAVAGSPAAEFFRAGDILLSIDGKPLNTFREVELATQRSEVEVTVFRDGRELTELVGTVELSGEGIQRVVLWAGALVQTPHRAISVQRGIDSQGVYVSYFAFGSPASRSGLFAGRRIVGVDGQPTPDLDSFLAAVNGLENHDSVRLNTVTRNSVPQVITLRMDNHYWPSYELRREADGWRRYQLQ